MGVGGGFTAVPLAAFAVSQRAGACCVGPGIEGGKIPPYLHSLNMSEAQRDEVFEIMLGQAPAMRDNGKAVRNAEESLRALARLPDYSEDKARELVDGAAKAMAEMSLARLRVERQVYEMLTPEQRSPIESSNCGFTTNLHFTSERKNPSSTNENPAEAGSV